MVHDRGVATQDQATTDHDTRLAQVEELLATTTAANALEHDGERYIAHRDACRLLGILHDLSDAGAEYRLKRAIDAKRLRSIHVHKRARLYAAADILDLLRNA